MDSPPRGRADMFSRHFLPVFGLIFIAASVLAGSELASVSGAVTDPSGAVVSSASIRLHQIAGTALLTATSDRSGHFAFAAVAPGEYLLDASASGLTISETGTVVVTAGESKTIAVHLVVSAVKTQVSFTAAGEPQSVDQISKAFDMVNASDAEQR